MHSLHELEILFTRGKCLSFAKALARERGYRVCVLLVPFYVLEGGEPDEDYAFDSRARHIQDDREEFLHAFCLDADGRAIDFNGRHDQNELIERYANGVPAIQCMTRTFHTGEQAHRFLAYTQSSPGHEDLALAHIRAHVGQY